MGHCLVCDLWVKDSSPGGRLFSDAQCPECLSFPVRDAEKEANESLKDPWRRKFLVILLNSGAVGTVLWIGGCAPALFSRDYRPKTKHSIHLTDLLKNELTDQRETPGLLRSHGRSARRTDFEEHRMRPAHPGADHPGLDIAPVADPTVIVPAAAGYSYFYIIGMGNKVIHLMHPFGYRTEYSHLETVYRRNRKVERKDELGIMGKTGRATRVHLHFELHGPAYSHYLSGIKVFQSSMRFYVLDPEEFSLAGQKESLPYQRPVEKKTDDFLWEKHFEAQKWLARIIKEFPTTEVRNVMRAGGDQDIEAEIRINADHGVRPIDKEINFIYGAFSEETHRGLFSKNDEDKILATLRGYMRMVPRLTAPIQDPKRPGDYRGR